MVIEFNPNGSSDRETAVREFRQKIKDAFVPDQPRSFNHEQILVMLLELAKNTFDHSKGKGLLEVQIANPIRFAYSDTGQPFDYEKGSQLGVSEKAGNGINYGIGLALVREGAAGAGFDLVVDRVENATRFMFSRKSLGI